MGIFKYSHSWSKQYVARTRLGLIMRTVFSSTYTAYVCDSDRIFAPFPRQVPHGTGLWPACIWKDSATKKVAGSIPGLALSGNNRGQVVRTHLPVTKQ